MSIPEWPRSRGPRVLTLAGNDLTIDTRARKTASSLARAGCSVIAVGIDNSGRLDRTEGIEGALLVRITPSTDPRLSPRRLRLSLPEMRDSLAHRLAMRRSRLGLRRRNFTARRWWATETETRWVLRSSGAAAWLGRRVGTTDETQHRIESRARRSLRRVDRVFRLGPTRAILKLEQRVTQALGLAYRAVVRASDREPRSSDWRRDLPELHRYEAAIGPLIDSLEPDLIHVHDIFHLGLAARAKGRAVAAGRMLPLIYDAQEFIPGIPAKPRHRAAYTNLEEEYVEHADAIVTVSKSLADLIESRYGVHPSIVLNTPDTSTSLATTPLRDVLRLGPEVPLIVYVGGLAPDRGAEVLIDSISGWPEEANLVFVTNSNGTYAQRLREELADSGLENKVRFAPFVEPEAVVSYLESADVSVIPLSRDVVNYEVALPNKLFQSIHARVPVVVSDNPEMARFVETYGIGEVFKGEDSVSLAKAVTTVLSARDRYVTPMLDPSFIQDVSWSRQVETLLEVYSSMGIEVAS